MRLFFKQPNKKRLILTLILIGLVLAVLLIPQIGRAVAAKESTDLVSTTIANVVGAIVSLIVAALGFFSILVIKMIIVVASYNSFIQAPAVNLGWTLVRDICNMFFILILLIIAFSTALGYEKFHYSKTLAPLLVAAVLINFSKLICGLLIDFSQIIMLAFVSSFAGAGGANFTNLVGFTSFFEGGALGAQSTGLAWQATIGYVMAVILTLIFLVVLLAMLAILVVRIVTLWFLVVLSPFVFFAQAVPTAQRYASQWWEEFGKQLMIGPVMAIFIWISLSVVSGGAGQLTKDFGGTGAGVATLKEGPNAFTAVTAPADFLHYVIGIGMMMGTLMVAQQFGGAGAKIGGAASKFLTKVAMAPGKAIGQRIGAAGKVVGQYATGIAKGVAGATFGGTYGLMKKIPGFGKAVGAPEAGILGLKKLAAGVKDKMMKDQERIAEKRAKGQSLTAGEHFKESFGGAWLKSGWKDRYVLQAKETEKFDAEEERLKKTGIALNDDRLVETLKKGSPAGREAARRILEDRSFFDKKIDADIDERYKPQLEAAEGEVERTAKAEDPYAEKGARDSLKNLKDKIKDEKKQEAVNRGKLLKENVLDFYKGNPEIRTAIEKSIGEKSDHRVVVESIYNGLKNPTDKERYVSDSRTGKIKIEDSVIKLDENQFATLKTAIGGKELMKYMSKLDDATLKKIDLDISKQRRNEIEGATNINKTSAEDWDPGQRRVYAQLTGNLQNVYTGAELRKSIGTRALRGKDLARVEFSKLDSVIQDSLAQALGENRAALRGIYDENTSVYNAVKDDIVKIANKIGNTNQKIFQDISNKLHDMEFFRKDFPEFAPPPPPPPPPPHRIITP